jgi:hypothetical protein
VAFASCSFEALWRDWESQTSPAWLQAHVARLHARYSVSIASGR